MDRMTRLLLLLGCCGALWGADLTEIHSVYVMPMNRGLDQYLANRLTNQHLFQVVTDPKLADAIFTDRIGENFQTQLENIFPPTKTAEEDQPAEKKDSKSDDAPASRNPMLGETVNRLENPALSSTFGRGKGNIFLVNARSREVIWSTFDPSKGTLNHEMDRTASDIVSRLRKDLALKKKRNEP
jgi:hypothetical protein